ncbi:hypothetical protein EUTSA_v10015540mg [Eutrema salsugineum]|uniref:FBD domain-containing protein n=2 Tax=Eutrema salsugineum TaxID=72664 RepID=V4NAD9_EUTSA|nr:hypothetical protein EUTSA_v10015540mg [Eutrema salsugineum]
MYQDGLGSRFSRFVYSSLHEAPILESLRLKLDRKSGALDIGLWVRTAVKRSVRELDIDMPFIFAPVILPWSLYTGGCKTLVTWKLSNMTLVDAFSLPASFPFLKELSLVHMKYPSEEFVNEFLSNCPVLEDLAVEQCSDDNVTGLSVKIPSLKNLSLRKSTDIDEDKTCGYVVDAPSLESFEVLDHSGEFCVIENNMPEIVYAYLDINYSHPWKILRSISSAKQLELCLASSKEYPVGTVFHNLVYLMLCTCEPEWLNLLLFLLRDSPKLRFLRFEQYHPIRPSEQRLWWSEPSSVPECILSSLEILEWVKYEGIEEEKEIVAFILGNARLLNKATISSTSTDPVKKLEMLKELSFLSRCSSTCHLTFD